MPTRTDTTSTLRSRALPHLTEQSLTDIGLDATQTALILELVDADLRNVRRLGNVCPTAGCSRILGVAGVHMKPHCPIHGHIVGTRFPIAVVFPAPNQTPK